ncbi:MAG: UDP-N-acetylmuramate--L-alanine ligase [Candidatus Berkelbacteria bacterium]|nr:UDP-N-acetylmuramate--L-alanine ligase [Candidatus Berkelbacteria bacterium]
MNKIHFIGIKGVGMTALALYCKEKGYEITGSDVSEQFITEQSLEKSQIPVSVFDEENINERSQKKAFRY